MSMTRPLAPGLHLALSILLLLFHVQFMLAQSNSATVHAGVVSTGAFLPFTHKNQSYVLVLQPETYVDAAVVCASHPALPGPGSLIMTEAMVPLFFELYVANPSLGNRLIVATKNASRSAPRVQEDFEMWVFDRYRACRGGVNVLAGSGGSTSGSGSGSGSGGSQPAGAAVSATAAPVTENFFLTTDVPCDWRLCFVCTEERTARALGMPVSSEWLAQYRAAAAAPSPFRLGPGGSGLALVRSGLVVGDPSPPPGATVAFDDGERFWRQGPVLGALYRGALHDLYALKPLREADGLDPWQLLHCDSNQSCLMAAPQQQQQPAAASGSGSATAGFPASSGSAGGAGNVGGDFYGAFEPARDGGSAWEGYNTLPYDYVVRVSGCFRGPVVERLLLTTRTGRRYQLGRGGCSTRFSEDAPPGGYLAGLAGAFINVSSWPAGPPPYPNDPIFIRQLQFIWAAPVAAAAAAAVAAGNGSSAGVGGAAAAAAAMPPRYSLEPLPTAAPGVTLPACASARHTVASRVGQLPGVCGSASGALCPSNSCCALSVSDGSTSLLSLGACSSGLMACQISCDPDYGMCGNVPEQPIKAFVNLEAWAGPSVYHVTEQQLTYNDAVAYCRSSTYMGLSWRIVDMTDVFGLVSSLDVRHKAYHELTGERFWISIRNDSAGPATYPCLSGAFGVPRGNETYPHSFWPSLCLDAHTAICRAAVAGAGAATTAGSPARQPNSTSALVAAGIASSHARWSPGMHKLHVSRTLGAGPFGASCPFVLAPAGVLEAAAGGPLLLQPAASNDSGKPTGASSPGMGVPSNSSSSSSSSSTPAISADALVTERLAGLALGVIAGVYNDTDPIDQVSGIRLTMKTWQQQQITAGSSSIDINSSSSSSTGGNSSGSASSTAVAVGVPGSSGWYELQLLPGADADGEAGAAEEDEVVVAVSGCAGGFVERLVFHTSAGRQWTTPFSRAAVCSASFVELPPPGGYLVGVQGYMGRQHLEALQLVWGVPLQALQQGSPPPAAELPPAGGAAAGSNTGLVVGLVVGLATLAMLMALVAMALLVPRFRAGLMRWGCRCCCGLGGGAGRGGAPSANVSGKEAELGCFPLGAAYGHSNGKAAGGAGGSACGGGGGADSRTTPGSMVSGSASEAVLSCGLGAGSAAELMVHGSAQQPAAQQLPAQQLPPPGQHEHMQISGCSSLARDASLSAYASSSAVRLEVFGGVAAAAAAAGAGAGAGASASGALAAPPAGGPAAATTAAASTTTTTTTSSSLTTSGMQAPAAAAMRRGHSMQRLQGSYGSSSLMVDSSTPAGPVTAATMEVLARLPSSGPLGSVQCASRCSNAAGGSAGLAASLAGGGAGAAAAAAVGMGLWQPVDMMHPRRVASQPSHQRVDTGEASAAAAQVRHMLLRAASQVRAPPDWTAAPSSGAPIPEPPAAAPNAMSVAAAAPPLLQGLGGGLSVTAAAAAAAGGVTVSSAAASADGAAASACMAGGTPSFAAASAVAPPSGGANLAQAPGRLSDLIRRHARSSVHPLASTSSGSASPAARFVNAAPPATLPRRPSWLLRLQPQAQNHLQLQPCSPQDTGSVRPAFQQLESPVGQRPFADLGLGPAQGLSSPSGAFVRISNSEGGGMESRGSSLLAVLVASGQQAAAGGISGAGASSVTAVTTSAALACAAASAASAGTSSHHVLDGLRRTTAGSSRAAVGGAAITAVAAAAASATTAEAHSAQSPSAAGAISDEPTLRVTAMSLESAAAAALSSCVSHNPMRQQVAALSTGDGRVGRGLADGDLRVASLPTPGSEQTGATRVLGFLPPAAQQQQDQAYAVSLADAVFISGGGNGRRANSERHLYSAQALAQAQVVSPVSFGVHLGAVINDGGGTRTASGAEIAAAVAAARTSSGTAALGATAMQRAGHTVSINAGMSMNVVLPPAPGVASRAYGAAFASSSGGVGGAGAGGAHSMAWSSLVADAAAAPLGDECVGVEGSFSGGGGGAGSALGPMTRLVLGRDVQLEEGSYLGQGASGTVRRGVLKLLAPAAGVGAPPADGSAGSSPQFSILRVPVAVKMLEASINDYYTPSPGDNKQQQIGSDGDGSGSGGRGGSAGGGATAAAATAVNPHLKALAAEVHVLSRLDHPNVVRFYGCNLAPPRPFIVEELMALPLSRVIHSKERDGSPTFPYGLCDVLRIARDISSALSYLHPTVLHRDLKPSNVLLDEYGTAKIGDFGLARFKAHTQLSATNLEVGTTAYCPPEVFTPTEAKVTDRADVWALATIVYEMVTRKRPWEGTRNAVIGYLVAIERRRPELPAPGHPLCPPALRSLIERCWRQNPEERPAAAEIVKRLTLLLAEHCGGEAGAAVVTGSGGVGGGPGAVAVAVRSVVVHMPNQQQHQEALRVAMGTRSQPHMQLGYADGSSKGGPAELSGSGGAVGARWETQIGSGPSSVVHVPQALGTAPPATSSTGSSRMAGAAAVAPGAIAGCTAAEAAASVRVGSSNNPRLLLQFPQPHRHGSSAPRTFIAAATIPEVPTAVLEELMTKE